MACPNWVVRHFFDHFFMYLKGMTAPSLNNIKVFDCKSNVNTRSLPMMGQASSNQQMHLSSLGQYTHPHSSNQNDDRRKVARIGGLRRHRAVGVGWGGGAGGAASDFF
jgi:hypothetical protein